MEQGFAVQWLPVNELELDKDNPRIRKWIEHYGDSPDFDQMVQALQAGSGDLESGGTATFQSLKESIRAQGGVINPIIVRRVPDGKYRVIEGNTRVAIYRLFLEDGVKGAWDKIPAIVHESIPPFQIDAIRLQCHIVGPRPWDPYSKAKYLDHLQNVENIPLSQIVELCGGRQKEIVDYIDAYRDMEKHYRPILESDSDFDVTRFSAFVELQKPKVKQVISEAGFTLKDFAKWVRDKNIDPLNTVRAIPRILKNPQAKAKFLSVGAREALKVLDIPPSPALANVHLEQLLGMLIERLNVLPWADVNAMKNDSGGQKAQLLMEANEVLSDLCKEISSD